MEFIHAYDGPKKTIRRSGSSNVMFDRDLIIAHLNNEGCFKEDIPEGEQYSLAGEWCVNCCKWILLSCSVRRPIK